LFPDLVSFLLWVGRLSLAQHLFNSEESGGPSGPNKDGTGDGPPT